MSEVAKLLERVRKAYASCSSYEDEGEQRCVLVTGEKPWDRITSVLRFRTAFVRPERYFFEYREVALGPEAEWKGALIWASPEGTWTCSRYREGELQRHDGVMIAAGAFGGTSRRTSCFALHLLMADPRAGTDLPEPDGARLVGEESVDGSRCHVLEGVAREDPTRIWIDADLHVVRKLEARSVYDETRYRRSVARQREHLAAMSANDPHRPALEGILADRETAPRRDFRTESMTTWRPRLDVDIAATTFEVVVPG